MKKLMLVLAIFLVVPTLVVAEDNEVFDILRIKVPYNVKLQSPMYKSISLRAYVETQKANYTAWYDAPVSADGTAQGMAVYEFQRSTKASGDVFWNTPGNAESGNAGTMEISQSAFEAIDRAKAFTLVYGLESATGHDGVKHFFKGESPNGRLVDGDDKETLKLSSTCVLFEKRTYSYSDNQAYQPDIRIGQNRAIVGLHRPMTLAPNKGLADIVAAGE